MSHIPERLHLTPLFYCFPNQQLAKKYIEFGATIENLNLIECFHQYKVDLPYLEFILSFQILDINNVSIMLFFVIIFSQKDREGNDILKYAYLENRTDLMQFILKQGGDINTQYYHEGMTLLHDACLHENEKMVSFLLEKGADINILSLTKTSTLQYAKASNPDYSESPSSSFSSENSVKQSLIKLIQGHSSLKPNQM